MEGQAPQWPVHFDHYRFFVQSSSWLIQQSCTLNEMQYLADRDAYKVTWFHKMMTQVPET
jgi:hypothetical protein